MPLIIYRAAGILARSVSSTKLRYMFQYLLLICTEAFGNRFMIAKPYLVIRFNFLQLRYWHPLKGSCQQKTPHHRKRDIFFCRNKFQYGVRPIPLPAPDFSFVCCAASLYLRTGTHQDQGQRKEIYNPWSETGPQKKIGTLSKPIGCYKI